MISPGYNSTHNPGRDLPVLVVILTSIFALLVSVWPIPGWALWLRPELALMLVAFWILTFPFRIGMIYAWVMGCLIDLLTGSTLCQHALAMTIVAYLVFLFHQRTVMYSIPQQSLVIFGLVALYHLLNYWIYGLTGGAFFDPAFLLSALTSALLWSLFRVLLDLLVARFT